MLDHPGFRDDIGQEDRGLVQLPFASISNRTRQSVSEVEWEGNDHLGKKKRFYRIVEGGAKSGLPVYSAEIVYVGLMYYAHRHEVNERMTEISMPRSALLATIGWDDCGKSYDRLERSLDQLAGVRIKTNALFDHDMKRHVQINMGLLQSWKWVPNEDGRSKGDIRVRWNEDFIAYLRRSQFKLLNVRIFRSLETNLAKRLYRWLDDAIYPTGRMEIDVLKLAHVKLGMTTNYRYVSQVMQKLEPALDELKAAGICYWSLEKSKTTPSGKKLVFTRATTKSQNERRLLGLAPDGTTLARRRSKRQVTASSPAQTSFLSPTVADRFAVLGATDEEIETAREEAVTMLDRMNHQAYTKPGGPSFSSSRLVDAHALDLLEQRRREEG